MKIKLNGLRGMGKVEICEEANPADFYLNKDEFTKPVGIKIVLQETADCIEGRLSISAVMHRLCDRCAIDLDIPLTIEQTLTFIRDTNKKTEDAEDIIYYRPDNPLADISQNIHDAVLLAIPMRILCKDDCKGLCVKCGADLNLEQCSCVEEKIDPRFAKLAELKSKLSE